MNLKIKNLTILLVIFALGIVSAVVALRFFGKDLPTSISDGEKVFQKEKIVEEESVVIDVVTQVSPSVVSIAVKNSQVIDFFGFPRQGNGQESGIGTGFVVSSDGLIITNKHVVSQDQDYIAQVKDNNGSEKKYDISEIHRDSFNDLAILKINASDLSAVELGDSDNLKVGQKVIAIGNALGRFENTVTTGVVSGLARGVAPT